MEFVHPRDTPAAVRTCNGRTRSFDARCDQVSSSQTFLHRLTVMVTTPFSGYMRKGDPRTPVWNAGGCIWPTVPPYRWRLGNENATGVWEFLKTTGVLFEPVEETSHDHGIWEATEGFPDCFEFAKLHKWWQEPWEDIHWIFEMKTPCSEHPWVISDWIPASTCNVDLAIVNQPWPYPDFITPGDWLIFYQVEFHQTTPPGGWPPWS